MNSCIYISISLIFSGLGVSNNINYKNNFDNL